jgi:glycosyltransferase involved in cell wall biosynthesis
MIPASRQTEASQAAGAPYFSAIIPTYNRAHLLPRAIQSVLAQTFTDFELIVVDDGSTDDSRQVVDGFDDPRIRYVYQAHAGQAAAKNLGARLARAAYIAYLDGDDEALPEWLEEFARALDEGGVGLVCGGAIGIAEGDGMGKETVMLPRDYGSLFDHRKLLLVSGSFAVRRTLFEAVGGYRDKASRLQMDLAIRLVPYCLQEGQRIKSLEVPVTRWYWHSGSRISTDVVAQYQGAQEMLEDYREIMLAKDPKRYGIYCNIAGVSALRLGKKKEARGFLWNAIRHYPWYWKFHARFLVALLPPVAQRVWPAQHGS